MGFEAVAYDPVPSWSLILFRDSAGVLEPAADTVQKIDYMLNVTRAIS